MIQAGCNAAVIIGPGGYGKTRLATRIADAYRSVGWCDCAKAARSGLASAMLDAFGREAGVDSFVLAQQRALSERERSVADIESAVRAWADTSTGPSAVVIDNFEDIADDAVAVELLAELIAQRPEQRHVIICSRVPLPRRIRRFLPPDRTQYVNASDLRMTAAEAGALLKQSGASDSEIDEALVIAAGWPMAVLLLSRFAKEGRLAGVLTKEKGTAFSSLFDYMVSEYLDLLRPDDFKTLIVAATLPDPTAAETFSVSTLDARRFADLLESSPFVTDDGHGRLHPHPILVALVETRFALDRAAIFTAAIAHALEREDGLRAAELAIARGDSRGAARYLAENVREFSAGQFSRLVAVLVRLERDAVLEQPELWASTLDARRFGMPLVQLVSEGRRAYVSVSPRTTPASRVFSVVRQYVTILQHSGDLDTARAIIAETKARLGDGELWKRLELMDVSIDSIAGRYVWARERFLEASVDYPKLTVKYRDLIDSTMVLRSGRYEDGMAMLEEAARIERQQNWIAALLVTLSNLAFEAWLHGDDDAFTRHVAELKATLLPGLERAWRFWIAAANGQEAAPTGYEPLSIVAIGHLFLACASEGSTRVWHARAAAATARETGDLGLQVHAYLTLSEFDPIERPITLAKLTELAVALDLEPMKRAIAAYVSGAGETGVFEGFVTRRLRGKAVDADGFELRVEVARSAVFDGRVPVRLTLMELALVLFLATHQRPSTRDVICDALWPDADADAAVANLKVVVHRVRKKIGRTAIVMVAGGYCLGPHAYVDLFEYEKAVRRETPDRSTFGSGAVTDLIAIADAVDARTRGDLLRFEWYIRVDRRLEALRRRALLSAARLSADSGNRSRARDLLQRLVDSDASDREASDFLVECLTALGDDAGAREEINRSAREAAADSAQAVAS